MRLFPRKFYPLLFLLTEIGATGIGKAWRVLPYTTDYWNQPSWPRLDTSAFEVRTVSGVGHLSPLENIQTSLQLVKTEPVPSNSLSASQYSSTKLYENQNENDEDANNSELEDKILKTMLKDARMTALESADIKDILGEAVSKRPSSRFRREAENETKMEQMSTTKNVREVRLSSPATWSSQPLSVELPRRTYDQVIHHVEDEDYPLSRSYHAPRADFVTGHHRRSYDNREPRDMPVTRGYDDYDSPWYRNSIRERDYEPPAYRRGYSYYYPDRYRTDRDYYTRVPNDYPYYYDRYREDDLDLYGRSRPTPKPKRIIYYATLPEIVRKPVDLRNYPRPYEATRSPVSRDGSYKRIPGNVDPSRYRFRNLYEGYDSYSKRSSFLDKPYAYPQEEGRRKVTLESLRNNDPFEQSGDRKLANQISVRNEGKVPWPVQIATEVSVKDDERISGRKIFGENNGYERFQNAQLQKAPDATGSSELQSDN